MCSPGSSVLSGLLNVGSKTICVDAPPRSSTAKEGVPAGGSTYPYPYPSAEPATPHPTPAFPAGPFDAEAFYHLPANLFVSPIPVAPTFTYKGYAEDGSIYETSLYDTQPEWL